jgi:signal transduction histidine kinase
MGRRLSVCAVTGVWRVVAAMRSSLGSVSRQFMLMVAFANLPVLVALIVFGWLMVISGDAAVEIAAIVVAVGAIAIIGSRLFARQVSTDIKTISETLARVADGERDVTIQTLADDELGALGERVNAMIAALAQEESSRSRAEIARRDLVAAVSHDLRTPITSLRLLTEAIGDDIVTGAQRRSYIDRLGVHVATLSNLIDDLFELSRLEAGDITWSMQRVDMHELVRETVDAMRVQAEHKSIQVSLRVGSELAPVRANPEKIQRVLFNLIQNAIRFTPADGSIVVHAESATDGVEVEVADSGPGIPVPERAEVFAAFFRGSDHAARSEDGSGLGLAIARAIVEAHGGHIWVAESGSGATVRFSLPDGSPRSLGASVAERGRGALAAGVRDGFRDRERQG